jgi:tyrosyl-tRNA synthetase
LLNNLDWIGPFTFLDFLRDVGKNFSVNMMLAKDSVKARLGSEAGLSYTEFSYMLLQAFDFVYLHEHYDCELQVGGSDQWGNITAGIDLARRLRGVQLYGCTCPLLTRSDGAKMGKTESGALWLSPEKTSPYHFYQYWINLDDADVGRCLRFFTDLGQEEIDSLLAEHQSDPGQRIAQRRLAVELTRLVHGDEGLHAAQRATDIFFGAEIRQLTDAQLAGIFAHVPSQQLPRARLAGNGLPIIDALVESGVCKNKSEARRVITQGGAYVNNRRVEGLETQLTLADLASESMIVLRSGKKNYALLRFA